MTPTARRTLVAIGGSRFWEPNRDGSDDADVLASEVRRIYGITRALAELIAEAEQTVIRRILRHGENAEKVIAETRALLAQSSADDLKEANDCLQRWSEQEIARFVERRPIGSNVLYPDATEPSLNL